MSRWRFVPAVSVERNFRALDRLLSPSPDDEQVWMPLTSVVGGVTTFVTEADGSVIPTLVPVSTP